MAKERDVALAVVVYPKTVGSVNIVLTNQSLVEREFSNNAASPGSAWI